MQTFLQNRISKYCHLTTPSDWRLWLLLEYCHNGDMKHFLIGRRAQLRAAIAGTVATDLDARLFLRWAHGIAKGMQYLASKRIMHGDLAARYIRHTRSS